MRSSGAPIYRSNLGNVDATRRSPGSLGAIPVSADPLWYALRDAVFGREFGVEEKLLLGNPVLTSLRDGLGETVLHFLAVENDGDGVSWLHAQGFDLDTKNDFGTPVVFEVAQLGYKELILWFLAQGVNIEARNRSGQNVIEALREYDKPDMCAFLLEHAPDLAFNTDAKLPPI